MCGRFTMTDATLDRLSALVGASPEPEAAAGYRPRYNVAPTDHHVVVAIIERAGERRPGRARWGLGDPAQIHARSGTALGRPLFRGAMANGRCLVPAGGFFEWTGGRKQRRPYWIPRADGELLLMAGLCARAPDGRM